VLSVLLLDERIRADGSHARTYARGEGGSIDLVEDQGSIGALSLVAVDRVMLRYGRPLDDDLASLRAEPLELASGHRLWRLRHHAIVDATGRDYLVWEAPGREPLAALATTVTAALRYLALRIAQERSQESEG
jgi:hypothetical protein